MLERAARGCGRSLRRAVLEPGWFGAFGRVAGRCEWTERLPPSDAGSDWIEAVANGEAPDSPPDCGPGDDQRSACTSAVMPLVE